MPSTRWPNADDCNCLALRQAARHVTQLYDRLLVSTDLRATQFSILARLRRKGPMTINALAADLVMDRTTLGRNILPLQRDGLIAIAPHGDDRRAKALRLTRAGTARLRRALGGWAEAQAKFETAFGPRHASTLRALLRSVAASDLGGAPAAGRG